MTDQMIDDDGWITVYPPPAPPRPDRTAQLSEARGILSDFAHHDDAAITRAARTVAELSPDPAERARAWQMADLVGRETGQ